MNIEQAIDILKNSIADYVIGEYCEKCADNKICDDRNEDCYYQQAIDIVLNLIEKQSKEIEELKKEQCCMTTCLRKDKEKLFLEDKIKAKIEELDYNDIGNFERRCKQEVLQSLLEEKE